MKYEANSLTDIANMFKAQAGEYEKEAKRATITARAKAVAEARARTWREAAAILEATTITCKEFPA
jgi:hypothetical protein